MTTYMVRWYDNDKKLWWHSIVGVSREEAEQQLERDRGYFWDDIPIELVQVEETVLLSVKSNNKREAR